MSETRETLAEIRDRIHSKSERYFTFQSGRLDRKKQQMFYGATDALVDAGMAAAAFGRAVQASADINLLVCYGFLQAIYVQQDAVWVLSKAVGLKWHPTDNERLREIRELRNRLTGHPAMADRPDPPSSAVISYHCVSSSSFRGSIYFEDRFELVDVDVPALLSDNEKWLAMQMLEIEKRIDEEESAFRRRERTKLLGSAFDQRFDYLVQRSWCDLAVEGRVVQAMMHIQFMREKFMELSGQLELRKYASDGLKYHLELVVSALELIENILKREPRSKKDQNEFDLIHDGFKHNLKLLINMVREIDSKLSSEAN